MEMTKEEFEKMYISTNITEMAYKLGVSVPYVYRKLDALGIPKKRSKKPLIIVDAENDDVDCNEFILNKKHGFTIHPNEDFQDPEWLSQKFNKVAAYIHLRYMAAREEKHVTYNKQAITLQRGQIVTSDDELRKLFNWGSRITVRKFLEDLKNDNKISLDKHKFGTIITVVDLARKNRNKIEVIDIDDN